MSRKTSVVRQCKASRRPGWRVGGEWRLSGARHDNGMRLGGYGLVNLNARYGMAKSWYIAARIENLLDKRYETVYTYRTPQRGAYVTLGWQQR
jgi:vitamin B12 transporter